MNASNEEFPIGGIAPHGGELTNRVLSGEEREEALDRARTLKGLQLKSLINLSDLELLAIGAFSPLTGFMVKDDYDRVVQDMHLYSGLVWSVPVTLAVEEQEAAEISEGQDVTLWQDDTPLAIMTVAEKYQRDTAKEAREVYRTQEEAHPGVDRLYRHGSNLLGGDIWLLNWPQPREFPEFRHTPAQTRRMFAGRGWRRIVGFQTRNPIHRAHEYIQKTAMEITDGLFLHPLVGETKTDDIPADVRMRSYEAILRDYYPADRVLLGVFPAAMRYAGPREALFHALARKNYGCTHFIVGRDHAGVGNYYGTYDAQRIFEEFEPEEIGITPLFFDYTFYCRKCGSVVSAKTCPHTKEDWIYLSGTQVRQMLERGEMLPEEFTRPEVSKILMEGIRAQRAQGEVDQSNA
jgi:sulfate adenylyltransferase